MSFELFHPCVASKTLRNTGVSISASWLTKRTDETHVHGMLANHPCGSTAELLMFFLGNVVVELESVQ